MRYSHLGILCCIALLVICALGVTAASGTVKILPLGDSITKGSTQTPEEAKHPTYRYWLWNDLVHNGFDIDFVGSWNKPNFTDVSFDQDNEGHGGFTTDYLLHGLPDDTWEPGYLAEWIQGYDFDMVLLMVGTNDVLRSVPTNETVVNIEKIITVLRQKNPRAMIFLSTIPPATYYRQPLIDLNQEILFIADRTTTPESPVILVDQFYGYDGVEDNQPPGYVHPDESGEKKIAKNWYDAITPYLRAPTPIPTPTPVITPVPTTVPTPEPTVIVTPPVITTTAIPEPTTVITTDPNNRFGTRRYTIGGMAGTTRGNGNPSISRVAVPGRDQSRLSPSDVESSTKPPSRMFVRWYPALRWATGLR